MGEYINRTRLLADILDARLKNKKRASLNILSWFENLVQRQPTADVVEVKHGYIIEHQGTEDNYCCECSVCGTHEVSLGDKYCSECGAKLDVGYAEPRTPKERGGEK